MASTYTTYSVVRGDCLWSIATKLLGNGTRWTEITDEDGKSLTSNTLIVPGQILRIPTSGGGGSSTTTKNTSNMAIIKYFGVVAETDRTLFATWQWDRANTKEYEVHWDYSTGNGVWFVGNHSNTEYKQSQYSAPSNATKIRFVVTPISETKKDSKTNTEVSIFTAKASTEKIYDCVNFPPPNPSTPTVTVEKYQLTVEMDNIDTDIKYIVFDIFKDNQVSYCLRTDYLKVTSRHVSYSHSITVGHKYKVRARAYNASKTPSLEYSDFSSNVETIPSTPAGFKTCKANSETSVYLAWNAATAAKTYDIEYATKKTYFDITDQTTTITGLTTTSYEKTGLESGETYFFRLRAVNDVGESSWSGIKSVTIGKKPAAPTTWSSTTTAVCGEDLTLYWVHNSEDGSSQTYAELELIINGTKQTRTIKNSTEEDEKDKTSSFSINTSTRPAGSTIKWRVRTAGITNEYGDWSIQRTVDIYAPPTLELHVKDEDGNNISEITSFPFYISGLAGPSTQAPIGYHVAIKANSSYETVDSIGNKKQISQGDELYSKYFDIESSLLIVMSANNIDLENNKSYTVEVTVTMNSGLTKKETTTITVHWTDEYYSPNAEIGIDSNTLAAYIKPYVLGEDDTLVSDLYLSVYRREFDGSFTEIATNLDNLKGTFVTDPHPSLDFARYRIVATSETTGAVSYYDLPGYPVGEKSIVIQWDEEWSSFDSEGEDLMAEQPWSGSMLKLPYNVDVSDNNSSDVSLIDYIGRKRPVSYYGTKLGETSSWNTTIDKEDKETLYALRRLAIWMGDVYVREPSGSGYWANISVSISQKHCDPTIPVSFSITRVEGGI